ncbi:Protein kinase superfamily protein [Prunus dulcis]|uniref:RING-type E3 ubiquitin transferase n=1 Tax=Prunus dulcis TaxID=3755 RepID=A0A4Y1QY98_PRUDU|nr:Protein kinase superfamily protein [Prunus dulcis]
MLLINFLCWLLIVVDVDAVHRGVGLEICTQARCTPDGPAIRFPFQLKGSSESIVAYHGFDLSCTNDNEIVLKMPASSDNLFIERIDYTSQEIEIYYRSNHPPREFFDLSLSSSPLQFMPGPHNYNYTLFSCPYLEERLSYGFCLIKLGPYQLDNPENQTYAVNAQCSVDRIPLVSCTKLHDYTSIPDISTFAMKKIMKLHWSKPSCRHCEEMGKACRSKISEYSLAHVQTAESECLDLPEDSSRRGTHIKISVCTWGLSSSTMPIAPRKYSTKKNQLRIERFLGDYIAQKPSRYSYADIKRITNQFKDKLGQGAYGTVFKRKLSSELLVAVKILNNSNENREDFTNEMGTTL